MSEVIEQQPSPFELLASINVNKHIEKKNGLSYLSWSWAWDLLCRKDPSANFQYINPISYGDTLMVAVTVRAFGKEMTEILPVMDNRNKSIPNPTSRDISDAYKRCLVKAIALHGLGLYVYSGEDLPAEEHKVEVDVVAALADVMNQMESVNNLEDLKVLWDKGVALAGKDADIKATLTQAKDSAKRRIGK